MRRLEGPARPDAPERRGTPWPGVARRGAAVWQSYWNLSADPFPAHGRPYVPTETHNEALARLLHAVESAQPLTVLRGAAGVGKSAVLRELASLVRSPSRRPAVVGRPADSAELAAGLADRLGVRVPPGASRSAAWKALGDAVRVAHLQRAHPVLVVDDPGDLPADERRDLARLARLGSAPASPLSVVLAVHADAETLTDWELSVRLPALTLSETSAYLAAKMSSAGRALPAFSPDGLARVHELSGGVPRGIDRLATLALMAGALARSRAVDGRTVSAAAGEFEGAATGFAA